MITYKSYKTILSIAVSTALLAGCGGSGSSTQPPTQKNTSPVTTTAPKGPDSTWTQDEYTVSSTFLNYCATPRIGTDKYTNNQPYPDKEGSEMHEKMWIRSYSHETYLWYDELEDNDPAPFNTVETYFDQLKTTSVTESGKLKDEFHFTDTYENYFKSQQAGFSSGFGIRWEFVASRPPRKLIAKHIQPLSPADLAEVKRGYSLVKIDGVDVVNDNTQAGVNKMTAALFPKEDREIEFIFEDLEGNTNTLMLTPADFDKTVVENTQIIKHGDKKIGYLQFNEFVVQAKDKLVEAFTQFSNEEIDELVLDIRYNGGGRIDIAAQLAYMIAGDHASGRPFLVSTRNDKRTADNVSYGFDSQDNSLPSVHKKKIYILTTRGSASASEAIINGLRGVDVEVLLIGDDTRGKPYGYLPTINCDNVYYTVQFKGANAKGFGDYENGLIITPPSDITGEQGLDANVPGCKVADDFNNALGSDKEGLLAGALHHITTGACPAIAEAASNKVKSFRQRSTGLSIELPVEDPSASNLILPIKVNQ